jgi:predicted NAD/FAD-dependent oxidoreductase
MNAVIRHLARGQRVDWATRVARINRSGTGWRLTLDRGDALDVDLAVIATPAEQSAELLTAIAPDLAARAQAAPSDPCWTLMLAFPEAVAVERGCWRDAGIIGWAARNNSKPGRTGLESWVVQASPDWSRAHLEADPDAVASELLRALSDVLGVRLPAIAGRSCHRWRFARSGAEGSGAILDSSRGLGLCGDWLIGPRVEAAWLSGARLADGIGALGA